MSEWPSYRGLEYLTNMYYIALNNRHTHLDTSKHHDNTNTQQIQEHRHIIHTHPSSLSDSKILEKTLLPYITKNIPHVSTEHGFTSNHSTNTVLHHINNTIAICFNQNKPAGCTLTVALGMNNAFDTVNKHIDKTTKRYDTRNIQSHIQTHTRVHFHYIITTIITHPPTNYMYCCCCYSPFNPCSLQYGSLASR